MGSGGTGAGGGPGTGGGSYAGGEGWGPTMGGGAGYGPGGLGGLGTAGTMSGGAGGAGMSGYGGGGQAGMAGSGWGGPGGSAGAQTRTGTGGGYGTAYPGAPPGYRGYTHNPKTGQTYIATTQYRHGEPTVLYRQVATPPRSTQPGLVPVGQTNTGVGAKAPTLGLDQNIGQFYGPDSAPSLYGSTARSAPGGDTSGLGRSGIAGSNRY